MAWSYTIATEERETVALQCTSYREYIIHTSTEYRRVCVEGDKVTDPEQRITLIDLWWYIPTITRSHLVKYIPRYRTVSIPLSLYILEISLCKLFNRTSIYIV